VFFEELVYRCKTLPAVEDHVGTVLILSEEDRGIGTFMMMDSMKRDCFT